MSASAILVLGLAVVTVAGLVLLFVVLERPRTGRPSGDAPAPPPDEAFVPHQWADGRADEGVI